MNLTDSINSYLEAIKELQVSVNRINGDTFLDNHKITLLFRLLETMAKGTYGDIFVQNTTRFEKFILDFCGWDDAKKVSLQQLALLLENTASDEFQRLKEYVMNNLRGYPMSSPVPFSYDSTIEEVKNLMPKGVTTIQGVELYSLTHVKLLWKYRNSLVHEARAMGSVPLFDFVNYPHYVHYTILNGKDAEDYEVWKISYPVEFFNNLVENGLNNMRSYLLQNNKDPRGNYAFGELWVRPRKKAN